MSRSRLGPSTSRLGQNAQCLGLVSVSDLCVSGLVSVSAWKVSCPSLVYSDSGDCVVHWCTTQSPQFTVTQVTVLYIEISHGRFSVQWLRWPCRVSNSVRWQSCTLLTDDAVRNELMEQLPVIVRFCHHISELNTVSRFLPVIVEYLTDASSQVGLQSVWFIL